LPYIKSITNWFGIQVKKRGPLLMRSRFIYHLLKTMVNELKLLPDNRIIMKRRGGAGHAHENIAACAYHVRHCGAARFYAG
jgi:hypothetical protein